MAIRNRWKNNGSDSYYQVLGKKSSPESRPYHSDTHFGELLWRNDLEWIHEIEGWGAEADKIQKGEGSA